MQVLLRCFWASPGLAESRRGRREFGDRWHWHTATCDQHPLCSWTQELFSRRLEGKHTQGSKSHLHFGRGYVCTLIWRRGPGSSSSLRLFLPCFLRCPGAKKVPEFSSSHLCPTLPGTWRNLNVAFSLELWLIFRLSLSKGRREISRMSLREPGRAGSWVRGLHEEVATEEGWWGNSSWEARQVRMADLGPTGSHSCGRSWSRTLEEDAAV